MTAPVPSTIIDPATTVGLVALTVTDLDRSIAFYTDALGFEVVQRADPNAVLGADGTPILLLTEQPGALPWMIDGVAGLYHFAILLPSRLDLGRWLRHYLTRPYPPPGQGDHLVSEAFYLRDPDGHGIEVYRDRPRADWPWENGRVRIASDPIDIRGLLATAAREGQPWRGLPAGTTIGHIHLQVGDLPRAAAFYRDLLGFEVMAEMPTALFVSAGGYHHHLGMNTWHSQGAGPAAADTAKLRFFTIVLPSDEARAAVRARLAAAGWPVRQVGDVVAVDDPWHNTVLLHVGPIRDVQALEAV